MSGGSSCPSGSPTEVAAKLNEAQRDAKVPLLVAADLERGAGFRFRGAALPSGPHLSGWRHRVSLSHGRGRHRG